MQKIDSFNCLYTTPYCLTFNLRTVHEDQLSQFVKSFSGSQGILIQWNDTFSTYVGTQLSWVVLLTCIFIGIKDIYPLHVLILQNFVPRCSNTTITTDKTSFLQVLHKTMADITNIIHTSVRVCHMQCTT